MTNVASQDQAAASVFDVVIPSLKKRFGDCTAADVMKLAKKAGTAGRTALQKSERLKAHAEGRITIPEPELRQLLSKTGRVDPDLVAMDQIEEILKRGAAPAATTSPTAEQLAPPQKLEPKQRRPRYPKVTTPR